MLKQVCLSGYGVRLWKSLDSNLKCHTSVSKFTYGKKKSKNNCKTGDALTAEGAQLRIG